MSKFVNPLHHVVAVTVDGVEHVKGPGAVWEATGEEAAAWKANPGVKSATSDDENRAEALAAVRATGSDPNDTGLPSGTITTIEVPTLQDHARGLVRDNVEVAQQPTVPVTGGGELVAVPDEKAAFDRIGEDGVSHEEFQALQGAEAGDAFDAMTDEELREWAEADGVDLGRSSSRNGILTKIRAHEAEKADEAEADGSTLTSGSVPGVQGE